MAIEEHYSPSTGDKIICLGDFSVGPTFEEYLAWSEAHPDAIRMVGTARDEELFRAIIARKRARPNPQSAETPEESAKNK